MGGFDDFDPDAELGGMRRQGRLDGRGIALCRILL